MLKIYNDLTHKKEIFKPLEKGKVRLYVCGMTVYDLCHLGHARVMVVFDVVVRYLRSQGYDVTYIRNITDIDDKIIQRANQNKEDFTILTQRFIDEMHQDSTALGILPPDQEPRATAYMAEIIGMIETLIKNKHAYVLEDGDVYYAVNSFKNYGQLSGKSLDDLQAGARVSINEAKKSPLDFALWKAAKPDEPYWQSPWGNGRPGWHIECSAMSTCCLGNTFDIHGGGLDLTFPHHENEIAQSEGATEQPFVKYWMHNGFVRINDEKMSKSLGNFFTIRDLLKQYQAEDIRYFILTSQYRSPLHYDDQHLAHSQAALTRFYTALRDLNLSTPIAEVDLTHWTTAFNQAMDDDFNTAEALSVLFELTREINRLKSENIEKAASLATLLVQLGQILGILQTNPEDYLKGETGLNSHDDTEIEALISQRAQAKINKDWASADRIRDQLQQKNIILEDSPTGTTWRRTRC